VEYALYLVVLIVLLVSFERDEPEFGFKRLHPDAVMPKRATQGSSGMDLHALETVDIPPQSFGIIMPTGLAVRLPPGTELQIRSRSGIARNTTLRISNAIGTVDSDYTKEICILIDNLGNSTCRVNKGDRIAQAVVMPVLMLQPEEIFQLGDTERGGFGSTGR
jgi:dUTP pyrophosphatase